MIGPDISVIVMTLNEEVHLRRCLESVNQITDQLFVVDCFSTDRTVELAKELGAEVFQQKWPGLYAVQFNWALDNLPIKTKWILRMDADEYLTNELSSEINEKLDALPDDVSGVILKRRHLFFNKWVKHGVYPVKLLRIFKYNHGRCEQRFMDEHITLNQGKTVEFQNDFIDHNLNDIGWWTQKHNGYATREAIDLLDVEFNLLSDVHNKNNTKIGGQAATKRSVKNRYARMPLFFRSFAYFFYRYFIRLGFLDGKAGFLWHFLQGWWYRTLVDARIWEVKKACGNDREKIKKYIRENFHYEI
jgi:glycosyltransferase involved in cell wall biosynthesis